MDISSLVTLLERLTKEKFFGKLEIKYRHGQPYFCIRQEFFQVTAAAVTPVEPMPQRAPNNNPNFKPQTT